MKHLYFLFISFLFFACQPKNSSFTLQGNLENISIGDTLLFTVFELPDWTEISVDTFLIKQTDYFSFNKSIEHTTFGLINVIPKDKKPPVTAFRGGVLLVRPGDKVIMTGSADCLGALKMEGGFYSDSLVARMNELEIPLNKKSNDTFRLLRMYAEENPQQPDSVQKYRALYQNNSPSDELREIRRQLQEDVNDTEYAAFMYLNTLYNKTYDQLEERLKRFTPEVRASYLGQRLEYMCRTLKNIEVGSAPQDFTVTDMQGNSVSLSDYKGKYLLLYHWGLCPGTIWVQPKLLELYKQYHEKGFEILGFTPDNYKIVFAEYKDNEEIKPLLDQPWRTVITKQKENDFIEKELYFSGVPILMLISPEGKTLLRGYTEIYEPLKQLLETDIK